MQSGFTQHLQLNRARCLQVVHVHTEAGARVSYKPYREVSASLFRLLQSFSGLATIEKASIDEAYILLSPAPGMPCAG